MRMNRSERRERERSIRKAKGLKRLDRHDPHDELMLLLPYDFWVDGEGASQDVQDLAIELGANQIVHNPWPDRLCRQHQAAVDAGIDVSVPCTFAIRHVQEQPVEEPLGERIDRLKAEMDELNRIFKARGGR